MPSRIHYLRKGAALNWMNQKRQEKGLAPLLAVPAGDSGAVRGCPLARGTGGSVGNYTYRPDPEWQPHSIDSREEIPPLVGAFIRDADSGVWARTLLWP